MNLQQKRDAGGVRRYHTVRLIGEQTVAQHSFNMCLIAMDIEPDMSKELYKAILYHDLPELVTGDMPATMKWQFELVNAALSNAETILVEEFNLGVLLTDKEKLLLKYADLLDLTMFCVEQINTGNKNMVVILGRGVDALRKLPSYNDRCDALVRNQELFLSELYL